MVQQYNKVGVTTDGYRGKRAILEQRVIEGFEKSSFSGTILQLTPDSKQTQYLDSTNMAEGNKIILPSAYNLWNNWQISIINDSSYDVPVYYYTDDISSLNLFKTITAGNMSTLILVDNSVNEQGTWTTFRTSEQTSYDQLSKYTSSVFEEIEVDYKQLHSQVYHAYVATSNESQDEVILYTTDNPITYDSILYDSYLEPLENQPTFIIDGDKITISVDGVDIDYIKTPEDDITASDEDCIIPLTTISYQTPVRSVFVKTEESFAGSTATVTIGTTTNQTQFCDTYDLTTSVSDTNFSRDLFDTILSNSSDIQLNAYFSGTNLNSLTAGKVKIIVEKVKTIDPTILKDAIIQTQVPLGIILNYTFSDIPTGYWRLNGSVIPNAKAAIPQFVTKLEQVNNQLPGNNKLIVGIDQWNQIYNTYGSCGKFAWQGTSLKFPAVNCFIKGVNDLTQLSNIQEAGLPNITGSHITGKVGSINGAFYATNPRGSDGGYEDWDTGYTINFDASRSSSIYGKSNTVTPLNIKFPYIISIYNNIQSTATIQLDEIIEDSVNKANISLDNLDTVGISKINNSCIPDYENMISGGIGPGNAISANTWIQVLKNSFVEVDGTDPNTIDVRGWVSPDNGTTKYQVGYFVSDINNNTRGTSFTFIVPAGWYFTTNFENGFSYYIYPLKGAN